MFSVHIHFYQIGLYQRSVFYPVTIFYPLYLYHMSLYCILNSIVGNDFGKSAKDHGLEIDASVALYGKQDSNVNILSSTISSGAGTTDLSGPRSHLHDVAFNFGSKVNLIVIRAVVYLIDSLLPPHAYKFIWKR